MTGEVEAQLHLRFCISLKLSVCFTVLLRHESHMLTALPHLASLRVTRGGNSGTRGNGNDESTASPHLASLRVKWGQQKKWKEWKRWWQQQQEPLPPQVGVSP